MSRSVRVAAFTKDSGKYCEFKTLTLGDPGPDEVVIKVRAVGICHTDLSISEFMPRPMVLGHETAGEVVQIGSNVTNVKLGDRVVATFGSCGTCSTCRKGSPAYCIDHMDMNFAGVRPNGEATLKQDYDEPVFSAFFQQSGFADYALVQSNNIVRIPDALSFEHAAPLGCGIQTGAGAILNSLECEKEESVVVFGVGAVGLSAVMAAKHVGASPIIAVDLDQDRLALAKKFGAEHIISGKDADLVEKIKSLTGGGAHYSLEGTGNVDIFHAAVLCLRPKGSCGIFVAPGVFGEPIPHPGGIHFMNTNLIGIIEGDSVPDVFIPELVDLHLDGTMPYDEFITTYPFEDINKALSDVRAHKVIKPVLTFDA